METCPLDLQVASQSPNTPPFICVFHVIQEAKHKLNVQPLCQSVSMSLLSKIINLLGFSSGSVVKNPPAVQEVQEMQVQSLGRGVPLKKEIAPNSSILAWRIPWTEESGGLQSMGSQTVGHDRGDLAHMQADFYFTWNSDHCIAHKNTSSENIFAYQ